MSETLSKEIESSLSGQDGIAQRAILEAFRAHGEKLGYFSLTRIASLLESPDPAVRWSAANFVIECYAMFEKVHINESDWEAALSVGYDQANVKSGYQFGIIKNMDFRPLVGRISPARLATWLSGDSYLLRNIALRVVGLLSDDDLVVVLERIFEDESDVFTAFRRIGVSSLKLSIVRESITCPIAEGTFVRGDEKFAELVRKGKVLEYLLEKIESETIGGITVGSLVVSFFKLISVNPPSGLVQWDAYEVPTFWPSGRLELDADTVGVVLQYLRNGHWYIKKTAAFVLGNAILPENLKSEVLDSLLVVARSYRQEVRCAALRSIGKLASQERAGQVLEYIEVNLSDRSYQVRLSSVMASLEMWEAVKVAGIEGNVILAALSIKPIRYDPLSFRAFLVRRIVGNRWPYVDAYVDTLVALAQKAGSLDVFRHLFNEVYSRESDANRDEFFVKTLRHVVKGLPRVEAFDFLLECAREGGGFRLVALTLASTICQAGDWMQLKPLITAALRDQ